MSQEKYGTDNAQIPLRISYRLESKLRNPNTWTTSHHDQLFMEKATFYMLTSIREFSHNTISFDRSQVKPTNNKVSFSNYCFLRAIR
jgi:hypothetical protein